MNQFIEKTRYEDRLGFGAGVACLCVALSSLFASSFVLFSFPLLGLFLALGKDSRNRLFGLLVIFIPATLSFSLVSPGPYGFLVWIARISVLVLLPFLMSRHGFRRELGALNVSAISFCLFSVFALITAPFVSLYPDVSIQKSIFFLCFILTVHRLVLAGEANLRPIFGWFSSIIFSSILLYFVYPAIGYSFSFYASAGETEGLYSGVLFHPQTLGAVIALSLPLTIYLVCTRKVFGGSSLFVMLFLASFALLYLTSSRTGAVAAIFSTLSTLLLLIWRCRIGQVRRAASTLFVCVFAVGAIISVTKWDSVQRFAFKAKDADEVALSGRDEIVANAWAAFLDSPFVGNGFQVPSKLDTHSAVGFGVEGSTAVEKSFFVTMTLEETGVVGFILLMISIVSLYLFAWRQNALIFIATFSTFLLINCGEATIFSPSALGGIGWIISMATLRMRV